VPFGADISMLMTTRAGRYPYPASPGIRPTFGRDGLNHGLQMLWWSPGVARGVLRVSPPIRPNRSMRAPMRSPEDPA